MNYPSKQSLYYYSKAYSLDPINVNTLCDRAILAKEVGRINTVRPVLPTAFGPEDMMFLQLPEAQTYAKFDEDLAEEAPEITEVIGGILFPSHPQSPPRPFASDSPHVLVQDQNSKHHHPAPLSNDQVRDRTE